MDDPLIWNLLGFWVITNGAPRASDYGLVVFSWDGLPKAQQIFIARRQNLNESQHDRCLGSKLPSVAFVDVHSFQSAP